MEGKKAEYMHITQKRELCIVQYVLIANKT